MTKKSFLICPVRGVEKSLTAGVVSDLENSGWNVHWPPRDTNQEDSTGLRICQDNAKAINEADTVHFVWDGKSEGCLFDLGIAFALNKRIVVVSVPDETEGKSFQNMIRAYEQLN